MTSIIYKIKGNYGECRRFSAGCASNVSIKVLGADSGILTVGDISVRLTGGVARFNLARLADGDHAPTLTEDGRSVQLEPIRKEGDNLTRPEPGTEIISRILLRLEAAEERVSHLEGRLLKTESKIYGHRLFGLERMKNEKD